MSEQRRIKLDERIGYTSNEGPFGLQFLINELIKLGMHATGIDEVEVHNYFGQYGTRRTPKTKSKPTLTNAIFFDENTEQFERQGFLSGRTAVIIQDTIPRNPMFECSDSYQSFFYSEPSSSEARR